MFHGLAGLYRYFKMRTFSFLKDLPRQESVETLHLVDGYRFVAPGPDRQLAETLDMCVF